MELKVRKIKNGVVIDHIDPGKGMMIYKALNLPKDVLVTMAINVPSKKKGRKDILKIENVEIKKEDFDKLSLISPDVTINIIKNGEVVRKLKPQIPKKIEGILKCTNPNCITHYENVKGEFIVESKNPLKIRCYYCERFLNKLIFE
ncbi:aspartate carbamoyltransferase regulatory subunit [Methanocaldococcus infernus]|uniref:Aspartate carbamoyltransferase regulatory chain n=1 Tax=Methanocaldococcus infernus (strain DSM 11812 / JCM 15783 / ME) TaxID=573063 RepID=D5VQM2_METIM|nr:aspartate carbamoyltransferase regulatory subunit [Methanocaldococcus infernus]ADG12875.1 aspartate carbamoyltransferase, regulatory subunit [Methanocaldococcus infernus ME]